MLFRGQRVLNRSGAGVRRTQCESQDSDDDLEADEDERPYDGDIFGSLRRMSEA